MATVSKIHDAAYVSGDVSISLNRGDLVLICGQWTWNTNSYYMFPSISALVNGVALTGYTQDIDGDGSDSSGNFMGIFPYVATSTASVNVSLSPTDTIAQERYIRLTIIKLVPDSGKYFPTNQPVIASATRTRDATTGNKTFALTNNRGDYLIGIATSLNPDATLRIAWNSPATEQADLYVNGYVECTVATQTSEVDGDEFSYTQGYGYYSGGVAVAVRESYVNNGGIAFLSDFGVM